jgi:purine-binding chemotaxis protein CheW
MAVATHGYLVFRVGRGWYGIDVDSVIEVLHLVALNEIPGDEVLGVMTLRDRAIKVFDLRRRFGLPDPQFSLTTPIIAVNTPHEIFGLVVDEADDVMQIVSERISPCSGDGIEGSFRFEGRTVFILGIGQLVATKKAE